MKGSEDSSESLLTPTPIQRSGVAKFCLSQKQLIYILYEMYYVGELIVSKYVAESMNN